MYLVARTSDGFTPVYYPMAVTLVSFVVVLGMPEAARKALRCAQRRSSRARPGALRDWAASPVDFHKPLNSVGYFRSGAPPMTQALLGLPCITLFAWLSSSDRRRFPLRLVLTGLLAQLLLAALVLKVPLLRDALLVVNRLVLALQSATGAGTALVFGYLGGGFPPPAIPGFSGNTDLSATPGRPDPPSPASGWSSPTTPQGLPVLRALSLCTCCRHYPGTATGGTASLVRPVVSTFPDRVVGSACALTLSRLARRSLGLRPAHSRCHQFVARLTEGFRHFVTSLPAPVASGWSGCRVGLAPTGKRRLFTAHTQSCR